MSDLRDTYFILQTTRTCGGQKQAQLQKQDQQQRHGKNSRNCNGNDNISHNCRHNDNRRSNRNGKTNRMAIVHVAFKSSNTAPPAAAHAQYIAREG